MYKPTANFNLSKTSKKILGTILDKKQRSIFKKMMIQAELAEIHAPRLRPGRGENNKQVPGDQNGN